MAPFNLQKGNKKLGLNDYYKNIYLYPYARVALYQLLKQLSLKGYEVIYIPEFICRDLLAPLNILNFKINFYKVDSNLSPILNFNLKTDIVLFVNYFGFPQNIEPFLEYQSKYNSILIEDNAHGLFSKDEDEKLLGTRGDFGLLSIRKSVFLPNGAVLLVNNKDFFDIDFCSSEVKETFEDRIYKRKLLLKKFFNFFGYKAGIGFLKFRRIIRKIETGAEIPLPSPESEFELPENSYLTPLLREGRINIDIEEEIEKRRNIYHLAQNYSNNFDVKPVFENLPENVVPYAFPFFAEPDESRKFERFLFKKGFYVLPWPDLPETIKDSCEKFYKKLWMVPFLW